MDHLPHTQLPDGTYLASEFNYSLPRQRKGYDTVGYKCHGGEGYRQRDHHISQNDRPSRGNDKGYYSDHTYESPMCGKVQTANSDIAGYHKVNQEEKVELCHSSDPDKNEDPRVTTLTFPRAQKLAKPGR